MQATVATSLSLEPTDSSSTLYLASAEGTTIPTAVEKNAEEEQVVERKCQLGRSTTSSGRGGAGKKQAEKAGWQHFKEPVESFITDG